ncbi:MAG: hypothetical protein CMB77_04030 [Euryarchaeota archaeon]|nr:hypothetical protein [Euryarchaeota archaeon]|tara:strand:+ start:18605 stop:19609 length:1005 start_codon:yes stop_codon:yes gene_type:complete
MSKKALVTGGCGFIGSNLAIKLVEQGWSVDVVDDLSSGDLDALKNLDIRTVTPELLIQYEESGIIEDKTLVITGDFASPYVLSRIADKRYDYVFHLAALPRVQFSVENPVLTTDQNVMKTVSLMTACIENVDRFIFSSSSSVYGDVSDNFPSRESGNYEPASPYALQKLVVENFCQLFFKLYKLESVCLRYFNVFGPGQPGDSPYSTAVSAWLDKIATNQPLRSDGDGEQTRDIVYIDDVVDANIRAAESPKTMSGNTYNVGTGATYSNNEILGLLKNKFGDLEINHAPERPGDVKHTKANIAKIFEDLGWKPKWDFVSGLNETIKWWGLKENS